MTEEAKIILDELETMKRDIREMYLTIENETNRKIKMIAEGHLDLSRKPDDASEAENEKEMLLLKVIRLESELEKLKARIEEIA